MNSSNHRITVQDTEEWGLGLYAVEPISKGEVYLTVPEMWLVSHANIVAGIISEGEERSVLSAFDPQTAVAGWLALRKSASTISKWTPWIEVLPSIADFASNGLFMNPSEVDKVVPIYVREDLKKFRSASEAGFEAIKAHPLFENVGLEEWRWGKSVITSRAWHIPDPTLVPAAGMLNHQDIMSDREELLQATNGVWRRRRESPRPFLDGHYLENGVAVVKADRNASPKTQMFEAYGDNPSFVYFVYHGFDLENNVHDCFRVTLVDPAGLPLKKKYRPLNEERRELFFALEVPAWVCLHENEVSDEILALALLSVASDVGFVKQCAALHSNPAEGVECVINSAPKDAMVEAQRLYSELIAHEVREQFPKGLEGGGEGGREGEGEGEEMQRSDLVTQFVASQKRLARSLINAEVTGEANGGEL